MFWYRELKFVYLLAKFVQQTARLFKVISLCKLRWGTESYCIWYF